MKTVYCPVIDAQIDGDRCLEIVLVADDEINENTLPDEIIWNEETRRKCLNCQYHDYLD